MNEKQSSIGTKKLTTIFWWYSEANEQSWSIHWILLDVFFYIQLSFSIFFMDSKVNCQIHMITDMFKNIWKEYFIKECFWSERNILCVRFYHLAVSGCVIIACLNVIYTKFRCVMIAQLNKIWHVWACTHAIARHSQPGLLCWCWWQFFQISESSFSLYFSALSTKIEVCKFLYRQTKTCHIVLPM